MNPATAKHRRCSAPQASVTDLHRRYARQIHRFCARQLGNREAAEDATQQTFINALRGLENGASLEFEAAWLFKIATNVCRNSIRSSFRRRRIEAPSDALDNLDNLDNLASLEPETDALIGLVEALRDLPELQRRAVLLREWQGLSYKEIATVLAVSQSAVEMLLFRGRRSLAEALDGQSWRKSRLSRIDPAPDPKSNPALAPDAASTTDPGQRQRQLRAS
jgi:RNA polymerase sigma-70 factor, ECF subfamily